jgi:hypothetical protein
MNRLLLAVTILALATPRSSGADPFSEFRIPAHTWSRGTFGLGMNGNWSANNDGTSDTRTDYAQESFGLGLLFAHDSDRLQHSLTLEPSQYVSAEQQQSLYLGGALPRYSNRRTQRATEDWSLSGSARVYPGERPVGISGSLRANGDYQQGSDRDEQAYGYPVLLSSDITRTVFHTYSYGVSASVGVGLGRVRDATVVQDVHVLEQRLLAAGAISGPLSPETRRKLAELRYAEPAYRAVYERPNRRVWGDIERVLREDGALQGGGLDAASVMRAVESYEFGVARLSGWFVGPVFRLSHDHQIERDETMVSTTLYSPAGNLVDYRETPSSSRNTYFSDDVQVGGTLEAHRPLGWHWQLDLTSSATGSVRPHTRGMEENSRAAASWLIADRWLAQVSGSHQRSWHTPGRPNERQTSWRTQYASSVGWYVEDHVLLSASVGSNQTALEFDRMYPGDLTRHVRAYSRNTSFSLGLSYRFLGRMSAPGLIGPLQTP